MSGLIQIKWDGLVGSTPPVTNSTTDTDTHYIPHNLFSFHQKSQFHTVSEYRGGPLTHENEEEEEH